MSESEQALQTPAQSLREAIDAARGGGMSDEEIFAILFASGLTEERALAFLASRHGRN